jgi:hypothetical protein
MKSARLVETSILLDQQMFETVYLDMSKNVENLSLVSQFVQSFSPPSTIASPTLLGQIGNSGVLALLQQFQFAKANNPLFSDAMYSSLLLDLDLAGFKYWDVAIYTGEGDLVSFGGIQLKPQRRTWDGVQSVIRINGDKMRIASRGAEQMGLSDEEKRDAHKAFYKQRDALEQSERKSLNISDSYYRQVRKRPLLMIHVLEPKDFTGCVPKTVVGIGLSLPACESLNNKSVKYAFARRKQYEYEQGFLDMDEDFEDDV